MAVSEMAASVDRGLERSDIEAAWFGELATTDGFPIRHLGRQLRSPRHPRHQSRERVRHRPGRVAQRGVRGGLGLRRHGPRRRRRQGEGDIGSQHVLGLDGHDPGHGLGLSARTGGARQFRPARPALPPRGAGHAGAPRDDRGEEPQACGDEPQGPAATGDHHRTGAVRPHGGRTLRGVRLHAAVRRRRGAPRRRRGACVPLHRPASLGAGHGQRRRSRHAPAQGGHDDLPRHRQSGEGGLHHGRDRPGGHRRGRGPRLLHRCGAHELRGLGVRRAVPRP